ncbi:MAG: DNA-processing protein DprA [Burkholderiales bacterium]|nr:DNA-processing protein DprA [Burkholderiales bacterium]
MDPDELAAWLRLVGTVGVGRDAVRRLLAEFGSPEAVLGASPAARKALVGAGAAAALADEPLDFADLLAATLAWLGAGTGIGVSTRDVVVLGDPRYPEALLQTADPPTLLYVEGRVELLGADSIAIVGSRNPTAQGLENARAFGRHLSRAGLVVVSGLALGVDGAAHEGALEGAAAGGSRGGTIAVVGTGLDRVYPASHRALAHRIAAEGLIVSEFPIGTNSRAENFPIRNRIIAGLSRGTLVVEAALRSGSLITARLALEAGREVFAIPGSIHSPQARGCNALLKQGAKLVDSADDILEEFAVARPGAARVPAAAQPAGEAGRKDPVLAALGFDPIGLDALVARTGMGAAELAARLLELELSGRVARLPGQVFQRVERG